MVVKREYEDLRGDGNINLFLREGKKPKYYLLIVHKKSLKIVLKI